MNSFLLGLTAVLIVVLGALFAAPLFIDWNDYRPVFETQAGKLLGREVKVGGNVHLVLLPAPELRFDEVKVADEQGHFDKPLLEARSIAAWLNIGALLRGAVEARKITIAAPVLRLALKEDGTGNWGNMGQARTGLAFAPQEVSLDEVKVSGGRIEVIQPERPPLIIDNVEGKASAASLYGPYKVSAAYTFEGRPQELHFSTSASDADGLFRLKSALRDPDRSMTYLLDGDVAGLREKPSYDGVFIMRIAASLPAAPGTPGQAAQQDQGTGQQAAEQELPASPVDDALPTVGGHLSAFELKGKLNATPGHAELPAFEMAIHTKGRSQMMKGKLALDFGVKSKATGELSARWIDVDTLLAASGAAKPRVDVSAAGALSALTGRMLNEAASIGEGSLLVKLEQASIGGDLVGGIDLALTTRNGAVTIDRLKAELPGETHIEASGRLTRGEAGPVFAGPITLAGSRLRTLIRWAAGDRDISGKASVGAFALSTNATLGGGGLKFDEASGELSGTKFSGALRYYGGEQRLIDLTLDSDRLDLREVLGESAAWRSWLPVSATKQEGETSEPDLLAALRDDEVLATLRVGELLLPNIPPGKLDAKFSLVKDTLDVERLDFAAQGAIALNGNGRIERLSETPAGQVNVALQAATPQGLHVASELFGLTEGATNAKQLAAFVPLDLHMGLTAGREGNATDAWLEVKGKAGGADVSLLAKARGEPAKLAEADIEFAGTVEGERPHALLSLLIPGLATQKLDVAGVERGKFSFRAHGVPKVNVTGVVELSTASVQAGFAGHGSLKPDGIALSGQVSAKSDDASLALLVLGLEPSPSASGIPLDLRTDIVKKAQGIDLVSISGEIAGEAVDGSAHIDTSGSKPRFALNAKVASASLPSLLGSLVAWQQTVATEELLGALREGASKVWPTRGFSLEPLVKAEGEVKLDAKTLTLGAPLKIKDAVLVARLDGIGLSITELQGRLFGGSLAASATLQPRGAGAELKAHAELTAGKLDQLSQSLAGRVLARGPFAFSLDVSGEGLSPPGLVAGLNGEGTFSLDPGVVRALSPEPLKRVAARMKQIKADKDRIAAETKTLRDRLTRGTYPYAAVKFPFEIKNGTLKFEPRALANKGAKTLINGYVELASLRVDSEWVMQLNSKRSAGLPPVSLVLAGSLGDAGAITPVIDTAPIETYLTVRRMQEDVERLENLDVSGRGKPPPAAEPLAERPAEPKRTSAKPPAEAAAETKPAPRPAPQATAPAQASPPRPPPVPAEAPPVPRRAPAAAAASPEPRAAGLEPDPRATRPPPSVAEPEVLPWARTPARPAQGPILSAPEGTQLEQATPAAVTEDSLALPTAPRVQRAPRPSRPPPAPDDWKKGIGIFGGG